MFEGLTAQFYGEEAREMQTQVGGNVHGGAPAKWNSRTEGFAQMPKDLNRG